MRTSLLLSIIAAACLVCSACGYRGPLYMPNPASTPQTIHVNAPAK
jgi:predicted small lipoprotein YifL